MYIGKENIFLVLTIYLLSFPFCITIAVRKSFDVLKSQL